ncbi:MAG: hypothetical protein J0I12_16840 [Candidatus Eremiobacteraeota bacterium]|nr:hypothetical protein [Candidatus Eremiobacteraeota bacterium]
MNRRMLDGLWMTALLSACALGFYPVHAAPDALDGSVIGRRPAKFVGNSTLIVTSADKIDCIEEELTMGKFIDPSRNCPGPHRQEILLEYAPAAEVMAALQARYKDAKFIPHPTLNGFYVTGNRGEILQMKSDVPKLDLPAVP